MSNLCLKTTMLALLVLFPVSAFAGPADGLSDLLIQKGVITSDELKTQQKKKSVTLEGRIQFRYTFQENEKPKDDISEFSIPRFRFGAGGNLAENVQFKVELDFVPDTSQTQTIRVNDDDTAGTSVTATSLNGNLGTTSRLQLKDVKVVFTHFDYANITVGHFKVPFARQEITSSGNQQFVERSEVVRAKAQSRDLGIMIGEYNGNKVLEYAIGAFNGTKTNNRNDNTGFLLAARVAFNPFGPLKYSESNLEGESLRLSIGANVQTNQVTTSGPNNTLDFSEASDDLDTDTTRYGVDLAAKFLDNASVFAEYIQEKSKPEGGTEVTSKGYYIQGGYFLLPPHLELTARYEQYDPNDAVDNVSDITWTTIGVNYFWKKHDWKLQANYILKDEKKNAIDNDTFMLQLQVKF